MLLSTDDNWAGDTEYDDAIKELNKIKTGMSEQWNKLIQQMAAEQHKGTNRLIAIIREHGREFERRYADSPLGIKKDGFVKFVKKELEKEDFPPEFKSALKYL